MEKYFTKLNLNLTDIDIDRINLIYSHTYEFMGTTFNYYSVDSETQTSLINRLPVELHPLIFRVTFAEMLGGGILLPHVDYGNNCMLNYYYQTGNRTTSYFTRKEGAQPFGVSEKIPYANNYRPEDVDFVCSFVAEEKSCYLLNVDEVHDVTVGGERRFLQYKFSKNYQYEEVLKIVKTLNLPY
jgi:hypothetical protein